jgi:hypothetical protein
MPGLLAIFVGATAKQAVKISIIPQRVGRCGRHRGVKASDFGMSMDDKYAHACPSTMPANMLHR